jgi:hypothetical protein
MKSLLLSLCLLNLGQAFADDNDHPMTKIIGDNIELMTKGHTLAGKVDDKLLYADIHGPSHSIADMTIKDHDENLKARFTWENRQYDATITAENKETRVRFVKIDQDNPAIVLEINGKEYTVKIESDDYQNNHFFNPTYSTTVDGKTVSFKLVESKACWMYSLQLSAVILSTYLH